MSSTLGLTPRYVVALSASFLFWIVPINIKAPKFVVFLSFLASGCGYLYAFTIATPLSDQQWYNANKRQQERDIMLHDLSLEQLAAEEALKLQYFGSAELEKEAIALEQEQQNLKQASEPKLLPDALPESLKLIIQLLKDNGGSITQRDLARKTKLKADQIQTLFKELQSRGYGSITSDGRTYSFRLTRQTG